jgi:hypothetical protein
MTGDIISETITSCPLTGTSADDDPAKGRSRPSGPIIVDTLRSVGYDGEDCCQGNNLAEKETRRLYLSKR